MIISAGSTCGSYESLYDHTTLESSHGKIKDEATVSNKNLAIQFTLNNALHELASVTQIVWYIF
jgi:hypothetical protein